MLIEQPTNLVLIGLLFGSFMGLIAILDSGRLRSLSVYLSIILIMISTGGAITITALPIGIMLLSLGFYQTINLMRLTEVRLDAIHLRKSALNCYLFIVIAQALVISYWLVAEYYEFNSGLVLLYVFLFIGLAWGMVSSWLIYKWLGRTRPLALPPLGISQKKLPTVSLLVPARNENNDLKDFLDSALANTYPKLEILVLDDCSTDKTPELIRSYAQNGIRFIGGNEPKQSWLAKNQAYDKLASEASGEILMFAGVDTRLQPDSINYCLNLFLAKKLEVLCIMPRRGGQNIIGALVQPMRYWLEFVGSQYFAKRPPLLSTCWLIKRSSYRAMGGMKAVKNSIMPEAHFVRLASLKNKYFFARAERGSGVVTLKSISDQIDTAIRVRYPSLKRRIELVWLLSVLYLGVMVLPFALVIAGLSGVNGGVWSTAFLITLLLSIPHIVLTVYSNPGTWLLSVISFPIVVVAEVVLMNISMWRYEFGQVDWKGRNICLPVMQVTAKLPKIEDGPPNRV